MAPIRIVKYASPVAWLLVACVAAGCMTNNYNCNVKDACRTAGEAAR